MELVATYRTGRYTMANGMNYELVNVIRRDGDRYRVALGVVAGVAAQVITVDTLEEAWALAAPAQDKD